MLYGNDISASLTCTEDDVHSPVRKFIFSLGKYKPIRMRPSKATAITY